MTSTVKDQIYEPRKDSIILQNLLRVEKQSKQSFLNFADYKTLRVLGQTIWKQQGAWLRNYVQNCHIKQQVYPQNMPHAQVWPKL